MGIESQGSGSSVAGAFERLLAAQEERPLATAVVVVLAQLAIRLPGLDAASLWWDEAWTAALVLQPASLIVETCKADQNPPLYYLLLSPWTAAFGVSAAGLRSFSLAASVLAGLVLHRLALRHYGREAALYAILAYATSGVFLYYAQEARSYALTALLCAVSFLLFLGNFERPRVGRSIALALVNAVAAYVHFTILLALVAQLVAALTLYRKERRALRHYLLGQTAAALLFLPWAGYLVRNTPQAGRYWLSTPGLGALFEVVGELLGSPWQIGATALVLAAGLGLAAAGRLRTSAGARRIGVLILWAVLPIGLAFSLAQWFPMFGTRYVLTAALGGIVLQAVILAGLPVRRGHRAAVALALAALALVSPVPIQYVKPDWRGAAEVVAGLRGEGSMVVVSPFGRCLPLAYYLEPEKLAALFAEGESTLEASGVLCAKDDDPMFAPSPRPVPARVIVVIGRGGRRQPREIVESFGGGGWTPFAREDLEGVVVLAYRRS